MKEFLSQKGVSFEERDVAQDEAALSELEQLGVMTTPVTLIDDEMVIGFDHERLNALLFREEVSDNG